MERNCYEINLELLIQLIKENPPIYNMKLKEYKDRILKEKIWNDIAKNIGVQGN